LIGGMPTFDPVATMTLFASIAARGAYLQLRRRDQRALTLDEVDLARLEELLDTGDVLRDDGILARDGLAQVETRALHEDPVLLAVRRDPVRVARVEERL